MKGSIQQIILETLDKNNDIPNTSVLTEFNQADVLGVLKSLESREIVQFEPIISESYILTSEGDSIIQHGSHEVRVFNAVESSGSPLSDIQSKLGEVAKFGLAVGFKNKWISKSKDGNITRLVNYCSMFSHEFTNDESV